MADKVRIELNRSGVRELLLSEEMADVCAQLARQIAGRAGDGYGTDLYRGRNRVNAEAFADTPEAVRDNLANNTLLKAVR